MGWLLDARIVTEWPIRTNWKPFLVREVACVLQLVKCTWGALFVIPVG
jgi:hypothetical protein